MHFNTGRAVAHDKFGVGFVTVVEGSRVTVAFHDDGSTRTFLGSFLRAPSKGLLPYNPIDPSDGAHTDMFVGRGNVAFTVVAAGVDEFVGATIGEFVIEDNRGNLSALRFVLEHENSEERLRGNSLFGDFCSALGVLEPQDTDDFVGLRGCLRVGAAGEFPAFARLAS